MSRAVAVANLLIDLEYELRTLCLWEKEPPSDEAFASTAPFCVDTMEFPQWLQWVFLPRMHLIVENEAPLPSKCEILPMAEEYFQERSEAHRELMGVLHGLDEMINDE